MYMYMQLQENICEKRKCTCTCTWHVHTMYMCNSASKVGSFQVCRAVNSAKGLKIDGQLLHIVILSQLSHSNYLNTVYLGALNTVHLGALNTVHLCMCSKYSAPVCSNTVHLCMCSKYSAPMCSNTVHLLL